MNKAEFLKRLEEKMQGYDKIDVEGVLGYYSEMIEDKMEGGMNEEEAVDNLGNVDNMLLEIKKFLPSPLEGHSVGKGFRKVWIDDSSADISFYLSKDDSAYVECMENEDVSYDICCEEDCLKIKRQTKEKWMKRFLTFSLEKRVNLKVYLPKREYESLQISTKHGDIDIRDFAFAKTEIKNMAGDVTIVNGRGDIFVTCLAGDFDIIGEGYGEIEAKLTAGDITIENASANRVWVDCTNGDVCLKRLFAKEIDVKAVNGDVELKEVDAGDYHLETVTGDIEGIILSYKQVEAKSTMGDVKVVNDRSATGSLFAKTVMGDIDIKVR